MCKTTMVQQFYNFVTSVCPRKSEILHLMKISHCTVLSWAKKFTILTAHLKIIISTVYIVCIVSHHISLGDAGESSSCPSSNWGCAVLMQDCQRTVGTVHIHTEPKPSMLLTGLFQSTIFSGFWGFGLKGSWLARFYCIEQFINKIISGSAKKVKSAHAQ